MIRISNIKVPLDGDIYEKVKKEIPGAKNVKITKKSIDARKKSDVHYVYTVDLCADNELLLVKKNKNITLVEEYEYKFPKAPVNDIPYVVVGGGPAGLMCAYLLCENGHKVILLERGKCVEERKKDVDNFNENGILDENSNVQFGEGGAGTFSDGKLTTGIKDFRIKKVLEVFVQNGAPEEILYLSKPHIGTDNLYNMVRSMRNEIIKNGGDVRFRSIMTGFIIENGEIKGCIVNDDYTIKTNKIVLATGHSARDTFKMLKESNVKMEQKSFSVGGRIEHSQEMINKSQYGEFYNKLGAADYKLSAHLPDGRGVYTFCMCPGGYVMASASEKGGIVTNGMSYYARDGKNANSALLVSVTPKDFGSDDVLAGMYLQREIEQRAYKAANNTYKAPAQYVGDFLGVEITDKKVTPTYKMGVTWTNIHEVLPNFVVKAMREGIKELDKRLKGFASTGAVITVPETRSSSPVRILRDDTMQSNIKGLYPCGEGAGYAGGIMSAAVDGIRVAERIIGC